MGSYAFYTSLKILPFLFYILWLYPYNIHNKVRFLLQLLFASMLLISSSIDVPKYVQGGELKQNNGKKKPEKYRIQAV